VHRSDALDHGLRYKTTDYSRAIRRLGQHESSPAWEPLEGGSGSKMITERLEQPAGYGMIDRGRSQI
jgi:hypothetical protein